MYEVTWSRAPGALKDITTSTPESRRVLRQCADGETFSDTIAAGYGRSRLRRTSDTGKLVGGTDHCWKSRVQCASFITSLAQGTAVAWLLDAVRGMMRLRWRDSMKKFIRGDHVSNDGCHHVDYLLSVRANTTSLSPPSATSVLSRNSICILDPLANVATIAHWFSTP